MPTAPEGLRVCVATDEFHPMGGTERQVVELAAELQRRGIPVSVLSRLPLPAGNPYVRELQNAGIRLLAPGWRGRTGGRLRRIPYVRARLQGGSPEYPGLEAQLWRWQAAKIRSMQQPGFVLHEVPFFGMISIAGRQTLATLNVPKVHTILGRMEGVVPIVDIPGAIATTDGDPVIEPPNVPLRWVPSMGPRRLADNPPDPSRPRTGVLTFGGRLIPEKGVAILLQAAAQLKGVRVVIAGYGPEQHSLESDAARMGVPATFTGPLSQAEFHALLARTDVAVFPGLIGEGLPSFVVEALGAGVPVVSTDVGAIGRALPDSPFVVPPSDPTALANAVRDLLGGDLRAHRRRAWHRFATSFSPASVVDEYLKCYADAMDSHTTIRPS